MEVREVLCLALELEQLANFPQTQLNPAISLPNHNIDPAVISGGSFCQIWKYSTPAGGSEQFYAKPLVFTPASSGRQVVLSFSE